MSVQPNIPSSGQFGNAAVGGNYVQIRFRRAGSEGSTALSPRSTHHSSPQDRLPEERAKLRDLWMKAKAAAECLWSSAKGDQGVMFGAAVELSNLLTRLWELKAHRDDNWVGILDQARTAIESLAAATGGIENATPDQCWNLLQLVETHLSPATKSIDDLKAAVRLVSKMGLNPYTGLEPLGDV